MTFENPKPDWLPLASGIFQFHHSTVSPDRTSEQLLTSMLVNIAFDFPELDAELDGDTITISQRHGDPHHRWNQTIGWFELGRGFRYEPFLSEVPSEDVKSRIEALLSAFVLKLDTVFRKQHSYSHFRLHARVGGPIEPSFSEIPPDVFAHFQVSNWLTGEAMSRTGVTLYSLHVAPPKAGQTDNGAFVSDEQNGKPKPRRPKTKAEKFAAWVIENHINRASFTLAQIEAKYANFIKVKAGTAIDEKTMNKGFRIVAGDIGD